MVDYYVSDVDVVQGELLDEPLGLVDREVLWDADHYKSALVGVFEDGFEVLGPVFEVLHLLEALIEHFFEIIAHQTRELKIIKILSKTKKSSLKGRIDAFWVCL